MKAAHLAPNGAVECSASLPHRRHRLQLDRSNFIERPVAPQLEGSVGLQPASGVRAECERCSVDGAGMIGVVEHEEIGDFFFAELSLHVVERKQSVGHRGEGKGVLCPGATSGHSDQMVACEGQRPFAAVPYGSRERSPQHRKKCGRRPSPSQRAAG